MIINCVTVSLFVLLLMSQIHLHLTETTEVIKGPEKVDDFLLSLFKALDKQKSKDDRKSVEKKVCYFFLHVVIVYKTPLLNPSILISKIYYRI